MIDLDPVPFEAAKRKTRAYVWIDEGRAFVLYRLNDQEAVPVMEVPTRHPHHESPDRSTPPESTGTPRPRDS